MEETTEPLNATEGTVKNWAISVSVAISGSVEVWRRAESNGRAAYAPPF
jgi:hypothetical protein